MFSIGDCLEEDHYDTTGLSKNRTKQAFICGIDCTSMQGISTGDKLGHTNEHSDMHGSDFADCRCCSCSSLLYSDVDGSRMIRWLLEQHQENHLALNHLGTNRQVIEDLKAGETRDGEEIEQEVCENKSVQKFRGQ